MSRGTVLFNDGQVDVGVDPGVQFLSIEADPLYPYLEFPNVGANGFVELGTAHAEVGGGRIRSKDSGRARAQTGRALRGCCWHGGLPPCGSDPCCRCWLLPTG